MNNRYKIIALFGKAGAGKDFIQKNIMKTNFGRNNFSEIISSTTRPSRQGEIDGVHYHFISSPEEFFSYNNLHKWIEFTSFRKWWYGTSIDSLSKEKINIGVFNINGIKSILEDEEIQCIPILITAIDKIRLLRQLNREENPDCLEITRRFNTDYKDFLNIPFKYYVIENNTNEFKHILEDIKDICYLNKMVKND